MSVTSFVYGFATAIVVIVGGAMFGAMKARQALKDKLQRLEEERDRNKKAVADAATLDPIKITSVTKVRSEGPRATNATVAATKIVLMGASVSFFTVPEDPDAAEKMICRVSTAQLRSSAEDAKASFKGDAVDGRVLVWRAAEKVFTLNVEATDVITIKFPTMRELERWDNVMCANSATKQWRTFVKSLPNLDVLNLFLSRIFFENRNGPGLNELIKKKVEKKLETVKLPSVLDGGLKCQSVDAGDEIPLLSNFSYLTCSTSGEMSFDFDLHYRGGFKLELLAGLSVKGMKLPPTLLTIVIQELRGSVHMSIGAPPSNKMWIGFHETPIVDINFQQQVMAEKGLLSSLISIVPDLSDVVSHIVKIEMFEDMVLPNMDDIPLPNVEDTPPSTPVDAPIVTPPVKNLPAGGNVSAAQSQWTLEADSTSSANAPKAPAPAKPQKEEPKPLAESGLSAMTKNPKKSPTAPAPQQSKPSDAPSKAEEAPKATEKPKESSEERRDTKREEISANLRKQREEAEKTVAASPSAAAAPAAAPASAPPPSTQPAYQAKLQAQPQW